MLRGPYEPTFLQHIPYDSSVICALVDQVPSVDYCIAIGDIMVIRLGILPSYILLNTNYVSPSDTFEKFDKLFYFRRGYRLATKMFDLKRIYYEVKRN